MNERINDLAMQLAEELEKYDQQQAAEAEQQEAEAPNIGETLLKAAANAARMKIRMDIAELVLGSELEIEDTDTLAAVMETIYDFVAAYEAQ